MKIKLGQVYYSHHFDSLAIATEYITNKQPGYEQWTVIAKMFDCSTVSLYGQEEAHRDYELEIDSGLNLRYPVFSKENSVHGDKQS